MYSFQSWELVTNELRKLETICNGFLRKIVTKEYKRKNAPFEYVKAKKKANNSGVTVPEPNGLDWAYLIDDENLYKITKTTHISYFCKIQHLKYIAM